MNELFIALRQFLLSLRPWVSVTPWEQALRVRAGKYIKFLGPGLHIKLPILDVIYLQSTRLRVSSFGYGRQTVTSLDGVTITFAGAVAYSIRDIEQLYRMLHHAEDTIQSLSRGMIAQFITSNNHKDCGPGQIMDRVGVQLAAVFGAYGLSDVALYLTDYAVVKTFRLIGDNGAYGSGNVLDTNTPSTRMT